MDCQLHNVFLHMINHYLFQYWNKEWIYIRSKDGIEGYIHVEDGKITNLGLPAEEVFSDLWFFG